MHNVKFALFFSAILCVPTGVWADENLIGRWCWSVGSSFHHVITIQRNSDGIIEKLINDNPRSVRILEEESENFYRLSKSAHGDTFQIVHSTGNLQLADDSGPITIAQRIGNTPQPNECPQR